MSNGFNNWLNDKKKETIKNELIKHIDLKKFLYDTKSLLFPGYVDEVNSLPEYLDFKVESIKIDLLRLLNGVSAFTGTKYDYDNVVESFMNKLPEIDALMKTDIDAIFNGDPAARNKEEIILCYPGFKAIFVYRVAHILYDLNVEILPRALSEFAHSKTGIDIHPGAKIGSYFFIDHGTGIVVGETTEIGSHVKIYQGVTLGALSLSKGHNLEGVKRHPTVMDNVTIYSGASIFGGKTVIGKNTTIGGGAFITSSVPENSIVTVEGCIKHKE